MLARILLVSLLSLLLPGVAIAKCVELELQELTGNIEKNAIYLNKLKAYEACLRQERKNKFNAEQVKQYNKQIAERAVLLESIEKIKENEKYTFSPLDDDAKYGDGFSETGNKLRDEYNERFSREKAAAAKRLGLDN